MDIILEVVPATLLFGLGTLKQMKYHFHQFMITRWIVADVKARLTHGAENNINAMGTLLAKQMPWFFYPGMNIREVGFYVGYHNGKPFFITSQDGEGARVRRMEVTIEMKCPCLARPY